MSIIEVKVPDIGDFKDVPVIDVLVKVGDTIKAEDALVTLESDKATMDVPSPVAGVVKEMKVGLGDLVAEGTLLLLLESAESAATVAPAAPEPVAATTPAASAAPAAPKLDGNIPAHPPVVASLLKPPPVVEAQSLGNARTAAKSVAPAADAASPAPAPAPVAAPAAPRVADSPRPQEEESLEAPTPVTIPTPADFVGVDAKKAFASPSVRQFARELGVPIGKVAGSGPKGRITREDVQAYVKGIIAAAQNAPAATQGTGITGGGELNLLPWPKVDFTKFGEVEVKPLLRIKKISGANLHRNWVMIPHVTQYDEADVTDLEAFRVALNGERGKPDGVRYTMLAFVIKACVAALQKYPQFNASIDGDTLVFKKYYHIGFAADTENGLVVPVVKNADRKSVSEIAQEMAVLSKQARDGKLSPSDMQGGCFSISSLGGIGGTYFTPLINAPEVAILGLSKLSKKPLWDGEKFVPREVLPLSLSYDHRVIDGAEGTRFIDYIRQVLTDLRRTMI